MAGDVKEKEVKIDPCFCILRLNIEIERISDDLFSICDRSVLSGSANKASKKEMKLEIKTPQKEVFSVSVPVGGKRTFSVKELGLYCLLDGVYCLETESCGDKVSYNYFYTGCLECDLDRLLSSDPDNKQYQSHVTKIGILKRASRREMIEQSSKIYESIKTQIQGCTSGYCGM